MLDRSKIVGDQRPGTMNEPAQIFGASGASGADSIFGCASGADSHLQQMLIQFLGVRLMFIACLFDVCQSFCRMIVFENRNHDVLLQSDLPSQADSSAAA